MKKIVKYTPSLSPKSLEKIKKALEEFNEQAHLTAYPSKRPKLMLIRGGKSQSKH